MLPTLITRILQMIFAVIVLGLSIRAANWQQIGSIPTTTAYCAFAGVFATLVAIVGLATIWLTAIPTLIMSGLDALTSVILLAGGIAYAAQIAKVDCGTTVYDQHDMISSKLLNGGCVNTKAGPRCSWGTLQEISGRCQVVRADAAFLFFGFAACVGAAVLCFMAHRRGSVGSKV